jgi:hypothetical protein
MNVAVLPTALCALHDHVRGPVNSVQRDTALGVRANSATVQVSTWPEVHTSVRQQSNEIYTIIIANTNFYIYVLEIGTIRLNQTLT